jgi:hypothetical protein
MDLIALLLAQSPAAAGPALLIVVTCFGLAAVLRALAPLIRAWRRKP